MASFGHTMTAMSILLTTSVSVVARKPLYLLGLMSMSGNEWPEGPACLPATQMAIKDVNSREGLLDDYELKLILEDTQCKASEAVDNLYKSLYEEPTKLLVLGPGCSAAAEATAQVTHLWNLTQISYRAGSTTLSDKNIYPRFFRLSPPDSSFNLARVGLLSYFNWKIIATVYQPLDYYASRHDRRIITILTDPAMARVLLCTSYKINYKGEKLVWMFLGWYSTHWWKDNNEEIDCSVEEMDEIAEGHLLIGVFYSNPKEERGVAGMTASEFKTAYKNLPGYTEEFKDFEEVAPNCYDVVWASALAAQCAHDYLNKSDHPKRTLDEFSYSDEDIGDVIYECMRNVSFLGVGGNIDFGEDGTPVKYLKVDQVQDGRVVTVARYDSINNEFEWMNGGIRWMGSIIPRDSTLEVPAEVKVPKSLYITMSSLAGTGILVSIIFLIFNIKFRENRTVKMSSPNLNNTLLFGCMITYSTVFMYTYEEQNEEIICKLKKFVFILGFSLSFGAMFAKTWRVYRIFSNKKLAKFKLKDKRLFLFIGCLEALLTLVLVLWEVIDPQAMQIQSLDKDVYMAENDVKIHPFIKVCISEYETYFGWTIYVIEGVLLMFGAFLAWATRKVKIEALNDSHQIGICLYNVVILAGLGLTLSLVLDQQVTLIYGLMSGFIILGTSTTQLVVFLPKILAVHSGNSEVGPGGDNSAQLRSRNGNGGTNNSRLVKVESLGTNDVTDRDTEGAQC